MPQDTIIKGKLNPVVIIFDFSNSDFAGLNDFTKITAKFGADERNSVDNSSSVVVVSDTELQLNFQDTTETREMYWCIDGDGYELSSKCAGNRISSPVCTGC